MREDTDAELNPGVVVSVEPMVRLPQGTQGTGGCRKHDILIVTQDGQEHHRLTFRPEYNMLRN